MRMSCLIAAALGVVVSHTYAEVWGIKSNAPAGGASSAPASLFRFAEDGSGLVNIGPITLAGQQVDADALAMGSPTSMYAYVVSSSGSQLVQLDPSTAAASAIGSALAGRNIRGATMLASGHLLVADSVADQLLTVDPASGAIVGAPVPVSINLDDGVDIAPQPGTGVFYINRVGVSNLEMYTIDITTGVATPAFADAGADANTPWPFTPGLSFSLNAPAGRLFAYEANSSDDIYYYDLGPNTRTMLYPSILASYNSGRGDLASPIPEPALLGVLASTILFLRRSR